MEMKCVDLSDPHVTLWMLQQMEQAMHRLNVSLQEVQRWLSGEQIPSDRNKFALYECFTNYQLLMQQKRETNNSQMAGNEIEIKAEPVSNASKTSQTRNKCKQLVQSKNSNRNHKNEKKSKSCEKIRNDANDKKEKRNGSLLKVSSEKYKKLVEPIRSIKSRGGGGILKEKKDEFCRLISRVDAEGSLQFMQWNGITLAHCFVKRTDTVLKIDPLTGNKVHDVVVSEGHKCKTRNCSYAHLYSQKCHWKRHALTEHCHRKFVCKHCGAIFRQQTQRKEHIVNKHKESMIKWTCPYGCGGVFSQFRGVVRHVKLDRKCDARNTHFTPQMVDKLKAKWDNDAMKNILQFKTKIDVDESKMVSSKMKIEIRKKTKQLIL